jgi:hypothetical protein
MRQRLARAALLAVAASLAVAMTGGAASVGQPPVVSGLDSYVVNPGQALTLSGDHFSSDVNRGDCSLAGIPTVVFSALDGSGDHPVKPSSSNSSVCSNTRLVVTVPGFGTGARIRVVDPSGTSTNTGPSGFYPQVTVRPSGALSPNAGPVGQQVTVSGSNLHPPTASTNSNFSLTLGGQPRSAGWGSSITFAPGNSSGDTVVSFLVSGDANNPANQQAVSFSVGTYTFHAPSLQTGAIGSRVVGDRVNLAGANLGSGGSVSFAGGAAGQGVSWSSGAIGVTVPPGAQPGQISVNVNGYGPVAGPSISLNPLVKAIAPTSGSAGDTVHISGYNFGPGAGRVTTGGVDQAVTGWTDQAVSFTLSADSDTGSTVVTRPDGAVSNAVDYGVAPHLDRLESDGVPAGSQVVIDGRSLGSAAGTASVAGAAANALLWSRDSVLIELPADLKPGSYPVVLVSAAGAASNVLPITVVAGPAAAPAGQPGGGSGSSGAGGGGAGGGGIAPSFDNSHGFIKPPKTDSAVQLTLDASPHEAAPGATADLVVTLKLKGKPVKGATVQLTMLSSPGSDYTFTPASGVTDADGVFKAAVKISGKPGENIILAQSGAFSDQDHVVGRSSSPVGAVNPAGATPWPMIGAGVAAFVLVVGGGFLQLRSVRLLA